VKSDQSAMTGVVRVVVVVVVWFLLCCCLEYCVREDVMFRSSAKQRRSSPSAVKSAKVHLMSRKTNTFVPGGVLSFENKSKDVGSNTSSCATYDTRRVGDDWSRNV